MARFQDQVTDEFLRPIPNCEIWVFDTDPPGQQAALTADLGGALSQPIRTDEDGIFYYNTADGLYENHVHYGGELRYIQQAQLGPIPSGPPGLANNAFATRTAMAAYNPATGLHNGDHFVLTEPGREGSFVVDSASTFTAAIAADPNQGLFVASTADASKVYRRVFFGAAESPWWGVSISNTPAANVAAYNAAIATVETLAVNDGYGYNKGGYKLHTRAGLYQFSGQLLTQNAAIEHYGDFTGAFGGGGGTVFKWTNTNSHGFNFLSDATHKSGGSCIRGFWLQGAYDYSAGVRAPYDAVNFTGIIKIIDCFASNWPRDGYHGYGNVGTGSNISNSFFCQIGAQFCDWTITIDGQDASTCTGIDVTGVANRFGDINDLGALGSSWTGGQVEGNNNDPRYRCRCHVGGHIYCPAYGQESWCSANAPTGAATSNLGWLYLYEGTANANQPTWTAGQPWYFGASVCFGPTNGSQNSVGVGIYLENYNPVIMGPRGKFVPGGMDGSITRFLTNSGAPHGGVILFGSDSGGNLVLNGGLELPGPLLARGANSHVIGPQTGTQDNTIYLDNTNVYSRLLARHVPSGTVFGTIGMAYLGGNTYTSYGGGGLHGFYAGPFGSETLVANLSLTGLDLPVAARVKIGGNQVLSVRQPNIAAPSGGSTIDTQSRTAISAVLALLQAHGLMV